MQSYDFFVGLQGLGAIFFDFFGIKVIFWWFFEKLLLFLWKVSVNDNERITTVDRKDARRTA